jgi:hypothetical protein
VSDSLHAAAHGSTPDDVLAAAVELARAAAVDVAGDPAAVGDHQGVTAEPLAGELGSGAPLAAEQFGAVATHSFAAALPGYVGWHWAVTVAHVPGDGTVTVDEVVLLPGEQALLAPAWVPWHERLRPGDLSVGDVLPTTEDDPRLVPAYLTGEKPDGWELDVVDEIGLGRSRVLSIEGRELASQRWYDSDQGPEAPLAQSAPGRCVGCGFLVRLTGPLSTVFGVCANEFANDDGRVVSLNHGCGAHSEAQLRKKQLPPPLPDHVFDTVSVDDYEEF